MEIVTDILLTLPPFIQLGNHIPQKNSDAETDEGLPGEYGQDVVRHSWRKLRRSEKKFKKIDGSAVTLTNN